jgi:hypothetical protein
MIDLYAVFEKFSDEYNEFDRIENPLHRRPDVCAFLLLDRLCPDEGRDLVTAAERDIIYLGIDAEKLAEVATEDDVLMLSRCGVRYSSGYDCLSMFV